jgi:hypothetical protein
MVRRYKRKIGALSRAGKKRLLTVLSLVLAAVLLAGAGITWAIATAPTESRANTFTVGNVVVVLEEPEWDENEPPDTVVWGNRRIKKDPRTFNSGKNPAWHFLEIWMPMAQVRVVSNDAGGNPTVIGPSEMQELFAWEYNGAAGTNPNWTQLFSPEESDDGEYMIYTFGYNQIVQPNGRSQALFTSVKAINLLEGDLPMGTVLRMPINTYAIQSDNLGETGGTLKERLEDIYLKFKSVPEED